MKLPDCFEIRRIRRIIEYQFGPDIAKVLLKGEVKILRSKGTGRPRDILVNGVRIATFRAHDGLLSLSLEGAKLILKATKPPRLRVIVSKEVADYVAKGRNVFARHVIFADPSIYPGMEVIVVDEDDNLLAIGRAVVTFDEMIYLKRGVAVKVRRGINEKAKS